jgi:hypothetical protein
MNDLRFTQLEFYYLLNEQVEKETIKEIFELILKDKMKRNSTISVQEFEAKKSKYVVTTPLVELIKRRVNVRHSQVQFGKILNDKSNIRKIEFKGKYSFYKKILRSDDLEFIYENWANKHRAIHASKNMSDQLEAYLERVGKLQTAIVE